MGRIQSNIGLITGVPIVETVNQLMAVNARPRDNLIGRTNQLQSEQLAIGELTAAVIGLQLGGTNLAKATTFSQKSVSSSDSSLLSASINGTPTAGTYQFTPLRVSQTQQLLSSGFANTDQPLGAGSISIQRGGFLDDAVKLSTLNGGTGVARGKIRITDRNGDSAQIDLRFAVDIDDVINAINNADGIEVSAVADGDHIKLIDQTGQTASNLRVSEVNSGSTAAGLGLAGIDLASDEATGDDILSLHDGVLLSQLNGGAGIGVGVSVRDPVREGTFIVDLIDPVKLRSVWRATVDSRMDVAPDSAEAAELRRAAAQAVFQEFPPGSAPAQ